MKTTNYFNTFIEVAEDCPVQVAEIPPVKDGGQSVANIHFELMVRAPYNHTSDDIIFNAYAIKNDIKKEDIEKEREKFFSKGQPCLRASPLLKRYGWGVHSNEEGKVALYAVESKEYLKLSQDSNLKHLKALRSKR